jgi:hypothetical protein
MRRNQDWSPFIEIADMKELSFEEKLDRYVAIADARFETDRFDEFCVKHLSHLDEVAWTFFGTPAAKDAVRQKVTALFPTNEVERFTEHFWSRIQEWRMSSVGKGVPSEAASGRLPGDSSRRLI